MPVDAASATRPVPPAGLVSAFVWLSLGYAFVLGLIYGSRSAGFMDLCHPAVAGTQFTAYMSVMNLTLAYSSWWQGWASERFGYPAMLTADAVLGLLCLVPLALMTPKRSDAEQGDAGTVASA
jgi:PAT family beta-lactamase induction signal transducer AmpG